jgi:hypothetical protein
MIDVSELDFRKYDVVNASVKFLAKELVSSHFWYVE